LGKNTFEVEDILEEKHGKELVALLIGPGGEKQARFVMVIS
jgi:aldehyde:ferredoxin oxidoreductase